MTIDPKTPYPSSFADLGGDTPAAEQDSLKRYSGPIRPPVAPQNQIPKPLPTPTQQDLSAVLQAIAEIYPLLKDYAPCRELSTAKTKLDEARLWIIELRNALRQQDADEPDDPDIPF